MPANRKSSQSSVPRPSPYPHTLREQMSSVSTLRALVPTSAIGPDDVVILVIGKTGSGMSNFINKLTGMQPEDGAGELFSRTTGIYAYESYRNGQRFIFVDTPGFNNQKIPQSEVFGVITRWLKETHQHSIKLTGVIYTHSVMDDRLSATDMQSFRLITRLCGNEAADRVRLVTTMWDQVEKSMAEEMQKKLVSGQWRSLIKAGARPERFNNTSEAAWSIVQGLGNTKKTLPIQKEPVTICGRLKRWLGHSRVEG